MTSRKSRKGFTLIELLIVLAIIAILATLAIYTYMSQLGKIRLSNSVKTLNSSLQLAKMRAATTSTPHGVMLERKGGPGNYQAQARIYIFIDCNRDGSFTDTDTDPSNNPIINSPADCPISSTRDPLLRDQPFLDLEPGVYFTRILGDKYTERVSLVFTELGYCLQGSNFVDGEIFLQNNEERNGVVDSGGISILGATGVTEVLIHSVVDIDAWKSGG